MKGTSAQLVVERVPNFNPQTTQLAEKERGTGPPQLHVSLAASARALFEPSLILWILISQSPPPLAPTFKKKNK